MAISSYTIDFLARWGHFLFGIAWIGLLYFLNFIQTPYLKEAAPKQRVEVISRLLPQVLWWFRWAAMFTVATGAVMLYYRWSALTLDILLGATLGTLMFLNVWLIIWPQQRRVIAANEALRNGSGTAPLPEVATAAAKAALASRTNVLFSAPMLFFMGASSHYNHGLLLQASDAQIYAALGTILLIEYNVLYGKLGPLATVRGTILGSLGLTALLWFIVERFGV